MGLKTGGYGKCILDLTNLSIQKEMLRNKIMKADVQKFASFHSIVMTYLFFPHLKTLRSRLNEHCSTK